MEPIDYGGALRRSWRLLVGLAIVGAIIAAFVPVGHAKKIKTALPYASSAVVGAPPNSPGSTLNGSIGNPQILFYANLLSTQREVAQAAGLTVPDSALPTLMSATTIAAVGTGLGGVIKKSSPTTIQLTAYGATPTDAILLANQYADTLHDVVTAAATARQAQNPKSAASTNPNALVDTGYTIQHPAAAAARTGGGKSGLGASRRVRVGVGFGIGAAIGAGIVLLRELLDKRLRNAARAEANFGFPVVVEIPTATLAASPTMAALAPMVDVIREPDSPGAEAYRMLRMSVMLEGLAAVSGPTDPYALGVASSIPDLSSPEPRVEAGRTRELGDRKVVLVVSAGSEPTRPHVAANLAAIYAEAGQQVVVISTGEIETGANGSSRASVNGEIRVEDVRAQLQPSRVEHVSRLRLSDLISRSGELVTRAPAILDAARSLSDVVIVEVPPMLAVHHAEALVHSVDVVLVVAECRFTTFDQARRAGDLLRRIGAPVLGLVLTSVRLDRADVRHSALAPPSTAEEEAGRDDPVLALSASAGSPSGSTTQTQA